MGRSGGFPHGAALHQVRVSVARTGRPVGGGSGYRPRQPRHLRAARSRLAWTPHRIHAQAAAQLRRPRLASRPTQPLGAGLRPDAQRLRRNGVGRGAGRGAAGGGGSARGPLLQPRLGGPLLRPGRRPQRPHGQDL